LGKILQLGLELDCSRALQRWFLHLRLSWARICRGSS